MNAVEAMSSITDRGRVLNIRSETKPSGVRIAVADSGTGLDPESMDRIFHAFFTTKPQGTGMGLSICQSIVEAHGGQLSASRSHPHGSIFEIVLPDFKLDQREIAVTQVQASVVDNSRRWKSEPPYLQSCMLASGH